VYTVIRNSLEKLALVGSIVVDPTVQAQELTQSVGEEITRMIAEQKKLEIRFEELISAQHALRSLPNKSKLRENQAGPPPRWRQVSCSRAGS
jgi:IQ domain-containing protein G